MSPLAVGPAEPWEVALDGDEAFAFGVGLVVSLVAAVRWYGPWATRYDPARRPGAAALVLTPPACLLGLFVVLQNGADPQVRGHAGYVALFLLDGGAWLGAAAAALPVVLGVSVRDDAVERRNGPAAAVACGALVGVMLAFAGANVGDGPTIWTTLGPAAVATAALGVVWMAHAAASRLAESITVDRDPAAAARTVGLHLATGLIAAGAVAGNWVSADATVADGVRRGWPAVALAAVALVVDRAQSRRPWDRRRAVVPSLVVALGYVVVAVAVVVRARRP